LFFRACGFRAVSVVRGYYADSPEDAYVMQFRHRPAAAAATASLPERITRLAG
jgi:hypothetical protein